MGEVSVDRAKVITEQAEGDAKKVSDTYKAAPSNGAAEANKVLQDEVSTFHNRSGQTPEERKLYIQALTKKLEEGDNALLPKISEAWLADPASKLSTDSGVSKSAVNKRLESDKAEQKDLTKPNSDVAMLEATMLENIKKKYFADGTTNDSVTAATVKDDLAKDEVARSGKPNEAPKDDNWDAAEALLANKGRLFKVVDAMGGSQADGKISKADLVKFCDLARNKDGPNGFNSGEYSEAEIKSMEKLRDRFNEYPLGTAGARGIESYNFLENKNFITRDSLAEGLEQDKETMLKTLGDKTYPAQSTAIRPNGDYDAAKALLMNGGKLFNVVDAMGGSKADGKISKADLVKFCDLARNKDGPNGFNSGEYSETEIKAMETLRDRFNEYPLGWKGARGIEENNFWQATNFITRESIAAGLGQDKETMVKTFGAMTSEGNKPADKPVDKTPEKPADKPAANQNLVFDPANPDQIKSAKYENGVTRTFEYENGRLSKINDSSEDGSQKHTYTVNSDGSLLENNQPTTYTDVKLNPKTGEFTYKDAGNEEKDTVKAAAKQFSDLDQAKQVELTKNVTEKLQVGAGQGYWQVADQVLRLNGHKNPTAAEVRELTEVLKKANIDQTTGKAKTVLRQRDLLLAADSKEFKDLLNRMAS